MTRLLGHRISSSLRCERGCSVLLDFWKDRQGVWSMSGPEVKIWGWVGGQDCGNGKAPTEVAGA